VDALSTFAVLANVVIQSEKLEEATAWAGTLGDGFSRRAGQGARARAAAAPIVRSSESIVSTLCEGGAATGARGDPASYAGLRRDTGIARRNLVST